MKAWAQHQSAQRNLTRKMENYVQVAVLKDICSKKKFARSRTKSEYYDDVEELRGV